MSEIKPVYQLRVRFNLWEDQTKKQYEDSKFGDGVPRILYPAAAYESLQKENAELKEAAKYAEHIDATPTNQRETMLYDTLKERDTLKAESAAQAKRIAELEAQIGWIEVLDGEDKMYESILARAKQSYLRHKYSVRGQQITRSDDLETHIILSAFEYLSAQKDTE